MYDRRLETEREVAKAVVEFFTDVLDPNLPMDMDYDDKDDGSEEVIDQPCQGNEPQRLSDKVDNRDQRQAEQHGIGSRTPDDQKNAIDKEGDDQNIQDLNENIPR